MKGKLPKIGDTIIYDQLVSRYKPTHERRTGVIEGYDVQNSCPKHALDYGKYFYQTDDFLVKRINCEGFRIDTVKRDSIVKIV